MPQLSTKARDFNWLVGNFAKHTPRVAHAMVVSADGLPVAVSDRLDRPKADQLAAIASGLASLTQGGARCLDGGLVKQTVVEMDWSLLVVMAISDGSCPTLLAPPPSTWGLSPTRRPCSAPPPVTSSPPALRAELQAALLP
jgi:uncharacterized protein